MGKARQEPSYYRECCGPIERQCGFILLPVVLAITLIATIAFLINTESAINVDMTANTTAAAEVEQVARAGLAHATWGVQNSGCAGDMSMTTVPFGQAGTDSYTATVTTPGGGTTAYPDLAADQDAWFRSDNITTNNGTNTTYHLRRESGNLEYAVVRFDLSTLPAGAQINSAIASFYVSDGKGHPEGPVAVHRATADWTETGATWETMGDQFDSAVLYTIPAQPDAGDVRVDINLTAQVQAWVNGGEPNYGIMLIPTGEGTHAEYISREGTASQQPRLDVIVGSGAASPVKIKVKATLAGNPSPANDIERTLTRTKVPAYQPPGNVTLQLGTDPGEDAILDSFYDTRNYGGADYLQVHDNGTDWQQYPLIRFDLAKLPRGAAVRSARLELSLMSLNAPGTATIHQVTRSWVEGTKAGGGTADGATWFTYDGTNPWTSAGGDINAPVVAETAIDGSETWVSWEIAPLVERWLAGEPNYGLQIRPDSALDQARFASKENSNFDVQPKLTITYACECGSPCVAPQGSGNVLMFVVNPTTLVPADAYKKALFESWGYNVEVISESANQSTIDASVVNNDVVYVSNTVYSNMLGTRLAGVPIGVVTDDGDYNSDLGFATGEDSAVGAAIDVTDTSHYITAVFPAGELYIYDADMEGLTVGGTPAPDLQPLANWGGDAGLAVLESGAAIAGGGTSAGRRVMLPLGPNPGFNWDYLNANGRLLLHRALQWGMNADGGTPPKNLLFVAAGATPTAQEQLRIDLIEAWGYTVNLIEDSDSQANFDTAAAANDVAYVSSVVDDVVLGSKLVNATIGVVNENMALGQTFGFDQGYSTKSRDQVRVLDNTHYITTPLATGYITILSSLQTLYLGNHGTAQSGDASILADVFNTGSDSQNKPGLMTLSPGDAFETGGGTAAGRRVQLPWGDATFDVAALHADGLTLMQRAIEWAEGAGAGTPAGTVLMVVADPGNLTAQEAARKVLIEGWGYTVNLIDESDPQANFDTALATADVAFVSLEVSATSLGTKLVDATIGVVSEHGDLIDDFGLASGSPTAVTLSNASIIDNTHYITDSFLLGDLTLVSAQQPFTYVNAGVAAGVQTLADVFNKSALLVADTGAELLGSTPAPGRRVQLPWGSAGFDVNALGSDALTIMQRALEWGAGAGEVSESILLVVADAGAPNQQELDRQTLIEGWGYTVNMISASDSQANFDTAVAAASAAYVVMQDSSTALGTKLRDASIAVINEEVELRADIGFSANRDWPTTRDTVDIVDSTHYITSPFATGLLTIATAPIEVVTLSGQMAGGLQVLGQQDHGGPQNSLSVIDTGGDLYGGGTAAGRRVQLPWGRVGFDINALNTNGMKLMQRAIEWGVAGGGGGGGGGGGTPPTGPVFEELREASISNDTILTVTVPTGTTSGDLLVAAVATDGNTATSLAPPAGWNVIHVADQGGAVTFGVWWKLAGASEGTKYDFTWSSSEHAYGWVMRFTGHDPASPINVSANTGGTSAAPTSPAVTTTVDDALVLRLGGFDDDDIDAGLPGLSGHTAINMGDSGNGPTTASGGSGYVLQPAAGDSGTSSFDLTNSEQYRAVTIAITPAP